MKGRIHFISDHLMYASRKKNVLRSTDGGRTWHHFFSFRLSPLAWLKTQNELLRRLFRMHIHHIVPASDSFVTIVAFGGIYVWDIQKRCLIRSDHHLSGSRPLILCNTEDGIYFGEYKNNKDRGPVRIFHSQDHGITWKPVHVFNNVRHIHGIFKDPYSDGLWITTGDLDYESAIWVADNKFNDVKKVLQGTQQVRAVSLLFTEQYIYFGSDSPSEKNFLYRFDRSNKALYKLQHVEGPVFWGCKVENDLFFSTVVEPSAINKTKYATIWHSKDGSSWQNITSLKKDILPSKLFQYGQIFFPYGINNTGLLWFTPFATRNHLTINQISLQNLA